MSLSGTFYDGTYHYFAQYAGGVAWTVTRTTDDGKPVGTCTVKLQNELGQPIFDPVAVIDEAVGANMWGEQE